jgi:succinyl-CoA synthetase beta subunit
MLEHDLHLLELNPVAVGREGCIALDAVIRRAGSPARAEAA